MATIKKAKKSTKSLKPAKKLEAQKPLTAPGKVAFQGFSATKVVDANTP